ncbi:IS110 family transposase [Uliginosibacterium sediminicola]|uniref:Transposase n=1 Tax=Uliginosibacterium sediminicola TaxID=2024550 RepID=A0ABU9YZG5_9RHOO
MEELKVVGLDLAKTVFQVHGINSQGRKLYGKKLKRSEVMEHFAKLPPVLVGMEACGGAHEWARRISSLGHQVKMMAPQHVKPFVQGNKTDARDVAAIAEAANRHSVPSVAIRSIEGQQMQALHRVRALWMNCTKDRMYGCYRLRVSSSMKRLALQTGASMYAYNRRALHRLFRNLARYPTPNCLRA